MLFLCDFSAPFLTKRLTIAIPIISSILFVLVIVNMLRTSCSDPGILPRASLAEVEDMERSYGTTAATYRPPPRTKDIIVNGQTVKSKYCFTCKMFRPPRASHCSICDNCVGKRTSFQACMSLFHKIDHSFAFQSDSITIVHF